MCDLEESYSEEIKGLSWITTVPGKIITFKMDGKFFGRMQAKKDFDFYDAEPLFFKSLGRQRIKKSYVKGWYPDDDLCKAIKYSDSLGENQSDALVAVVGLVRELQDRGEFLREEGVWAKIKKHEWGIDRLIQILRFLFKFFP